MGNASHGGSHDENELQASQELMLRIMGGDEVRASMEGWDKNAHAAEENARFQEAVQSVRAARAAQATPGSVVAHAERLLSKRNALDDGKEHGR